MLQTPPRLRGSIRVSREGIEELLDVEEFEKATQAAFVPQLDFADWALQADLAKRGEKLQKKEKLTREQLWFGAYYKKEIESLFFPDVVVKWIDPSLGWGIFANRDFKKLEYIAQYSGKVRKRQKVDDKNAYCFEYVHAQGHPTPYIIDARDQGGISRYINHSATPNLLPALATLNQITHVILIASQPIPKGTQLCYDYGPDYWSRRTPPTPL